MLLAGHPPGRTIYESPLLETTPAQYRTKRKQRSRRIIAPFCVLTRLFERSAQVHFGRHCSIFAHRLLNPYGTNPNVRRVTTRMAPKCSTHMYTVFDISSEMGQSGESPQNQPFQSKSHFCSWLKDSRGQGLVEYLLMLAIVAFGSVAAEQAFACQVSCAFEIATYRMERIILDAKKIPPGQLKKCSKKCG